MKKTVSLLIAFILVFQFAYGVSAAESKKIDIIVRQNCIITVGGTVKVFKNNSGVVLYPIKYGKTTYLPLKVLTNSEGKEVKWSVEESSKHKEKEMESTLRQDITVIIDGKKKDGLYPIVHDKELYLPAKTIEAASGKPHKWDSKNVTITIGSSSSGVKEEKGQKGGIHKNENMKVITPLSKMVKHTVFWGHTGDKVHINPNCPTFKNGVLYGSLTDCINAGHTKGWCGKCSKGWTDKKFNESGNPNIK